jgi:hypothetical protein
VALLNQEAQAERYIADEGGYGAGMFPATVCSEAPLTPLFTNSNMTPKATAGECLSPIFGSLPHLAFPSPVLSMLGNGKQFQVIDFAACRIVAGRAMVSKLPVSRKLLARQKPSQSMGRDVSTPQEKPPMAGAAGVTRPNQASVLVFKQVALEPPNFLCSERSDQIGIWYLSVRHLRASCQGAVAVGPQQAATACRRTDSTTGGLHA